MFTLMIGLLNDLPCFDILLQIIAVTLYEQLAVRLCLTSILTIALTGNNQRMWGGIAYGTCIY